MDSAGYTSTEGETQSTESISECDTSANLDGSDNPDEDQSQTSYEELSPVGSDGSQRKWIPSESAAVTQSSAKDKQSGSHSPVADKAEDGFDDAKTIRADQNMGNGSHRVVSLSSQLGNLTKISLVGGSKSSMGSPSPPSIVCSKDEPFGHHQSTVEEMNEDLSHLTVSQLPFPCLQSSSPVTGVLANSMT